MKTRNPFYLSKRWKETRLKVLRRDRYICRECGTKCLGKSKGLPSPQVDHTIDLKKAPELAYDLSNLKTLCPSCHSRKTMNEIHSRGKPEIGEDGYPIEPIPHQVQAESNSILDRILADI